MRTVSREQLAALQRQPEAIRNICILAHVDHGKTTLADSLLAANGIISSRLAGKLRYLDSRPDEQERGITMKASSIALSHTPLNRPMGEETQVLPETYLINVIDSPGHVDFSSEVTAAVRLCDGAIIVVDVVEGVCAQTLVALRHAWSEDIKPILVLNKIDRLIIEWKLTPLDAYVHLNQLLEKINAVMGELVASDVMGAATAAARRRSRTTSTSAARTEVDLEEWASGLEDIDDSSLYFSPAQGNVVFASAIDGWACRVSDFSRIYARKVGMRESTLNLTLWGDFYLAVKQRKILKGAAGKAKKPLFVSLVLESLWAMYETVFIRKDKDQTLKMIEKLEITVHPRDLRSTDRSLLLAIMSAWLPLSRAMLDAVVEQLPSPLQLTQNKVQRLLSSPLRPFNSLPENSRKSLETALLSCNSDDAAPTIVFISKMFAVERKSLPEMRPRILTPEEMKARREEAIAKLKQQRENETELVKIDSEDQNMNNKDDNDNNLKEEEHAFIAFARIYSGRLRKGQKLFVLGPKYDPVTGIERYGCNGEMLENGRTLKDLKSGDHVTSFSVEGGLYQLMGRELEVLEDVGAGNILGVGGLESHVLRTATLSSTLQCPPFTEGSGSGSNSAVVRVAVEAGRTCDIEKLEEGLRLLNQADPCVEVVLEDSGEHVLVTAGEVHLQRCIDDLTQRFAKVPVSVGKPMVPFRETIIPPPTVDMVQEAVIDVGKTKKNDSDLPGGAVEVSGLNKRITLRVRAAPLPCEVIQVLDESVDVLKSLKKSFKVSAALNTENSAKVEKLQNDLKTAFGTDWEGLKNVVDLLWAFGPKEVGPNVLINGVNQFKAKKTPWKTSAETAKDESSSDQRNLFESAILGGFQLAVKSGPLCEEPMRGVAFIVENYHISNDSGENEEISSGGGQLMSTFKEACRKAFSNQPHRLMVAMYSTNIQVNAEVLGKLYAVLGKRGGRVLHGDLACEGSTSFEVTAMLPVVDSFDFANEVRRQTSGLALPQLVFSGWEVVEVDPFWEPTTEEELAHYGEKADTANRARTYMNAVRRRKGLATYGEKIVAHAEKQRTLTRNK